MKKIVDWCNLAGDNKGTEACLDSTLSSLYWGGENDYHASIRFCNAIDDTENRKHCFQNLIGQVSTYIKDSNYRQSFCKELPVDFQSQCQSNLLLPIPNL